MKGNLKLILQDDGGEVTLDWIMLTAAMASFGIAVVSIIATAAEDPAENPDAVLPAYEGNP